MASAPKMLPPPAKSDDEKTNIPIGDPLEQVGVGRKRRGSRRRGGFRQQAVNTASPVPTGPQPPLGGRRRTRKSKGRKRQTRRR
jgi:hypothetical protein